LSGYSAAATLRTVAMFRTPGVASLKLTVTKRWWHSAVPPEHPRRSVDRSDLLAYGIEIGAMCRNQRLGAREDVEDARDIPYLAKYWFIVKARLGASA